MNVSIYFNAQRMRKDGSIPISICVSRPPKRFYINTGLSTITPFDDVIFPRSEKNHKAKTKRLMDIVNETEQLLVSNSLMPLADLKALIKERVFGEEKKVIAPKPLFKYIEDFAQTKKGSTFEKYDDTRKKVIAFDDKISLDIDVAWLERFEKHLSDTLKPNSVSIHLRNIRAVLNWCIRNDYTTNYPFRKYRIPKGRTTKRNLPIDTIKALRDMDLKDHHAKYRDMFMLMFYLIGINSKDLFLAKPSQLVGGRLEYTRYKTYKPYSIKVEKEALEIIERYRGETRLLKFCEHTQFKNFRNKMNHYLKELVPNLTTYYARHSWATIAYNADVPKDTISQALGHSMGNSTTEIYIERDYKKIDEANRKVLDLL